MTDTFGLAVMEIIDACERGRHELQPRYDTHRVGEVAQRKYVCDVCRICGHQVARPLTVADQIEMDIVTPEEVRAAYPILMQMRRELKTDDIPFEMALADVIAMRVEPSLMESDDARV